MAVVLSATTQPWASAPAASPPPAAPSEPAAAARWNVTIAACLIEIQSSFHFFSLQLGQRNCASLFSSRYLSVCDCDTRQPARREDTGGGEIGCSPAH